MIEDWTTHASLAKTITMNLEKDKLYKFKLEFFDNSGAAKIEFGWKHETGNLFDEAIEVAKQADYILVFAGTSQSIESEGVDRDDLILPRDRMR
jgi:hypothetical protein